MEQANSNGHDLSHDDAGFLHSRASLSIHVDHEMLFLLTDQYHNFQDPLQMKN